jgi:hypothetical protein
MQNFKKLNLIVLSTPRACLRGYSQEATAAEVAPDEGKYN